MPIEAVRRPRLEGRLGTDSGAAWTLVVGPPGSGKTTLVRSWLDDRSEPWCWVTVTAASYRRSDLANLIVRAVQRARGDRPLDVLDVIDMEDGDAATLLTSLADQLAAEPDAEPDTVLVIDDAHLLDVDEWALVRRLLDRLPPSLHVVIVSRSDPPMALARDRANGRMAEIRARELAFDLHETSQVLTTVAGRGDNTEIARLLHTRTEGWVVGVRLAAIAMRDGADPGPLLAGFAHRSTSAEFLLEEVLDRQPAERRRFLATSACLGVLDADLCDAVTGRTDSGQVLRGLAADGLFVTSVEPSDGRPGDERYRFHPLLAELLQVELADSDPDAERQIRLRAAEWLIDNDRAVEAIQHLLAAGEAPRAHQLVLDHFWHLYTGEHRRDLDSWLTAVPDEVIASSLDRAVEHCVALALVASRDGPRWWAFCTEHVPAEDDWLSSRLLCVNALYEGVQVHLGAMRTLWTEARRRRPAECVEPLDEVLASWEIRVEAVLGDPAVAVELGRALVAAPRQLLPDASALSVLAGALDAAGEHDVALAVAQSAVDRWQAAGEPDLPGMVDALVVQASAARRAGDLDTADDVIDVAEMLPPPRPLPHLLIAMALLERARIDQARGGSAWRAQLLRMIEEMRMGGATDSVVAWVAAAQASLESSGRSVDGDPSPATTRSDAPGSAGTALVDPLTDRELTILTHLASHLSLPEIAGELYISRHTVKSHVGRIYRKLGANCRSDAISRARQLGLLAGREDYTD